MKLFFEETNDVTFEQEMNETTGKAVYKISGIFSTIGEKNKNGRVYPANIWEREITAYQDVLANGSSNTLMELNHPPRANVEMMEAVAKINKLYIKGKYVMGEAILLNNPMANQLKSLIDAGVKMSVSSRGVGKVSATGMVENFKLSTYDIIPDQGQSDHNAQMMGIVEGVLTDKEFEILDDGCVGECELPSHAPTEEEITEGFKKLKTELALGGGKKGSYFIHKMGYSTNGNWTYVVSKGANKPKNIQHQGEWGSKITLDDAKAGSYNDKVAKEIIAYYEEFINEAEEFSNLKDMKAILEKYDAEILCDLDKETKEKVLKEFREGSINEKSIINKKQALWFLKQIRSAKTLDDLEDDFGLMAKMVESEIGAIDETDYKAKYEALQEDVAKYQEYAKEEIAKLTPVVEEVIEKTIEEKQADIREAFNLDSKSE